jgi:DNA-binding CsgD family transcriptional regulator
MSIIAIPGRASDAGPLATAEPAPEYLLGLAIEDAMDELSSAAALQRADKARRAKAPARASGAGGRPDRPGAGVEPMSVTAISGRAAGGLRTTQQRAETARTTAGALTAGSSAGAVLEIDSAPSPNFAQFRDRLRVTPREAQILDIAHIGTYADIAGHLGIAVATVRKHAENIKLKLGAERWTQAAILWERGKQERKAA